MMPATGTDAESNKALRYRRTRNFINLAMLTAPNLAPGITLRVAYTRTSDCPVEAIEATLRHATAYCGILAGRDALKAARETLVKEGALPGA